MTVSYLSHSSCPGPCLLVKPAPGEVTIYPGGSQAVVIKKWFHYFPIPWNSRIPPVYWYHRVLHYGLRLRINFKIPWVIVVSNGDWVSHFADIIEVDVTTDSRIMEQ